MYFNEMSRKGTYDRNYERGQSNKIMGLIAVAYATELAFGHDPCAATWETRDGTMRKHLLSCLMAACMTRFPSRKRRLALGTRARKFVKVPVLCICRMPWDNDSDGMIQCTGCKKWYHFLCVGLKDGDFTGVKWLCKSCSDFKQKADELTV